MKEKIKFSDLEKKLKITIASIWIIFGFYVLLFTLGIIKGILGL